MARVLLTDVKKSFGGTKLFDRVNLEIGAGEFVVFVGPSGSGKSTLLRMIAGLESVTDGVIEIDGEDVFAIVQTVTTEDASERQFECHQKFIDVQMVLQGLERQDVTTVDDNVKITEHYNEESDAMLFKEPELFSTLIMKPGMFVVYTPSDGHRPCCSIDSPCEIRKVCVKIKI